MQSIKTLASIFIFFIVIFISLFAETEIFAADVAPPDNPPGGSLNPSQQTFVQMMSEEVIIDIPATLSPDMNFIRIDADFEMYNHGDNEEVMQVRFPMSEPNGSGNGYGGYPKIESIVVQVDGESVLTTIVTSTNPLSVDDPDILWAAFDVVFPPKDTVVIDVSYNARPSIYYPFARVGYILETGAGWYDVINSADVIVRLPFEADRFLFDRDSYSTGVIEGEEIRWPLGTI
ncbi:MAG: hypothetical protein HC806_10020 [Anaerolineae bacterium]|nr:hypothetical protein [Anaerolineae bacterium]